MHSLYRFKYDKNEDCMADNVTQLRTKSIITIHFIATFRYHCKEKWLSRFNYLLVILIIRLHFTANQYQEFS